MGMTTTTLRPGDRVRAYPPALDPDTEFQLSGAEGVVTRTNIDAAGTTAVVWYGEWGPIPAYGYGPGDFEDPEWPLNILHRFVWLMDPGELELIEEEN